MFNPQFYEKIKCKRYYICFTRNHIHPKEITRWSLSNISPDRFCYRKLSTGYSNYLQGKLPQGIVITYKGSFMNFFVFFSEDGNNKNKNKTFLIDNLLWNSISGINHGVCFFHWFHNLFSMKMRHFLKPCWQCFGL